jgi:NADPH-dependent ferric siderophore reductase
MRQRETQQEIHQVAVVARERLTSRLVRLTLSGPALRGMRARPAQDIELLIDDEGRRVKRRYTIRRLRPDAGELDIDVLLHDGGGPGSCWAAGAAVGDPAEFVGPKGKLELLAADWHLFAGDEAALPAIAALTEALGPRATTIVLGEIGGPEDEIAIAASRLCWLYREGATPGERSPLPAALAELKVPGGVGRAYLLGESHTVHALRSRLAQLGISAERAFVKGYWNKK